MSSVRIESSAFGDDRFEMLARKAGLADADHARGKMARLWRTCTIEQRHILSIEEVELVLGERGPSALIASRLGEEARGGIRICGTKGRIEWLEKLRENGKKGGRPAKTKRFPSGSENETRCEVSGSGESNPLTLAPSLALAQEPEEIPEQPLAGLPRAPARSHDTVVPVQPPPLTLDAAQPALSLESAPIAPGTTKPTKATRPAKRQLPADWGPTKAHRALAKDLGVDADAESASMRDWARAKAESCVDWDARFSGWLRRAGGYSMRDRAPPPPRPRDPRIGYAPARADSHTTPDGIVRIDREL